MPNPSWRWKWVKDGRIAWDGQTASEVPITSPIGFTDTWLVMRGKGGTILADAEASHVAGIDRNTQHRVLWNGFCNRAPKNWWGDASKGLRSDGYLIPRTHTLDFQLFVSDRMPLRWTAVGMGPLAEGGWLPERLTGATTQPYRQALWQVYRGDKLWWWFTADHKRLVGRSAGKLGWKYHGWSQWPEQQGAWQRSAASPHAWAGGTGAKTGGANGPPRAGEQWRYVVSTDAEGEVDIRTGQVPAYRMFQQMPSGWESGGTHVCDHIFVSTEGTRRALMPGHSIDYAIPETGAKWVEFHIYSEDGTRVRSHRIQAHGHIVSAGHYRWHWEGRNDSGEVVRMGWFPAQGRARLQASQGCEGFAIRPHNVDGGKARGPGVLDDPANTWGITDVSELLPKPRGGGALWLMLPLAALALNR